MPLDVSVSPAIGVVGCCAALVGSTGLEGRSSVDSVVALQNLVGMPVGDVGMTDCGDDGRVVMSALGWRAIFRWTMLLTLSRFSSVRLMFSRWARATSYSGDV